MKHLLKMLDLSSEEVVSILNLADQLKYEQKHGIPHKLLEGKSLGLIFEKASTRTRVSFDSLFSSPQRICRSAEENRYRIPPECCHAIWTAL